MIDKRVFTPRLENPLESRQLLSTAAASLSLSDDRLANLAARRNPVQVSLVDSQQQVQVQAQAVDQPRLQNAVNRRFQRAQLKALDPNRLRQNIGVQVRRSARLIEVTDSDREHYLVGVIGPGVVRVLPDTHGRASIIVDGSTEETELLIEQRRLIQPIEQEKEGKAHLFSPGQTRQDSVLHVSNIKITSGQIGAISGFRTAVLSGRVDVISTKRISRIAFKALEPGASIRVGGDLDTLDVLNDIELDGASNQISIGRDLNLLNASNVLLRNGAGFTIGRSFGQLAQPPKGTGTGSTVLVANQPTRVDGDPPTTLVGGYIKGNISVDSRSSFNVARGREPNTLPVVVEGNLTGYARFRVGRDPSPVNNAILVATNGGPLIGNQLLTGTLGALNNPILEPRVDFFVRGSSDNPPLIANPNLNLTLLTDNPIILTTPSATAPTTTSQNDPNPTNPLSAGNNATAASVLTGGLVSRFPVLG